MHSSASSDPAETSEHSGSEWFDIYGTSLQGLADLLGDVSLLDPNAPPPRPRDNRRPNDLSQPAQVGDQRRQETGIQTVQRAGEPHRKDIEGSLPFGEDAPARVHQYEGLRLFADDPHVRGRPDDVIGVGPSGKVVAHLTVRRPAKLALDLGCGGGLLALLASRHTALVVGTDLNPRAIALAAINARWNEIQNVEFRQGDLFEPVMGMKFDLVVSNPPLLISPDFRFYYRDGSGSVSGICDRILARLPEFLEEMGMATIHAHWPVYAGETWWDQPRRWAAGSNCDLWLMSHGVQPPETYSRLWIENTSPDGSISSTVLDRWLDWYESNGIVGLASGVYVLRRRSHGSNWARAVVAPRTPTSNCSDQLTRIFAAHDFLTTRPPSFDLLSVPLKPVRGLDFGPSGASAGKRRSQRLARLEPDMGYSVAVSQPTFQLVEMLDGRTTPQDLIDSGQAGVMDTASRDRTRSELTQLLGSGFLQPPIDEDR